jgi:hypothetical protein
MRITLYTAEPDTKDAERPAGRLDLMLAARFARLRRARDRHWA